MSKQSSRKDETTPADRAVIESRMGPNTGKKNKGDKSN
jgi:hypothetical protein